MYIMDHCAIRKVTRSTGMISTIFGSSATDCAYTYYDGSVHAPPLIMMVVFMHPLLL